MSSMKKVYSFDLDVYERSHEYWTSSIVSVRQDIIQYFNK